MQFLLVNDVYTADSLRNGSGGLARVAALRDSLERASGSPVLFVLAGDVLAPSLLSKYYAGAQMVDAFNAARLDYAAVGNHEFDIPHGEFLARVRESRFQWLAGNCSDAESGEAFPAVRGWDTVRVNGVKVGIFSTNVVQMYPRWVSCTDEEIANRALVDTLEAVGADLIVGLTHRYMRDDSASVANDPRIHLILGGHEHEGKKAVVGNRAVIKARSNARTAAFVVLERNGTRWRTSDTVFAIGSGMREDSTTAVAAGRWADSLQLRIGSDRRIGITQEPIDATDSTLRRGEARLGNLIADGVRRGTGADVGLMISGAMRLDDVIPAGPLTTHTLESIFLYPDETRVVSFTLSGVRLREVLETGIRHGGLGAGPYPQVSGVSFAFDAARTSGDRIVGPVTRENGAVVASTEMLKVAFAYFPACFGGDGYRIPEARTACEAAQADSNSAPRTVDLVIQHVQNMGGRVVLPETGRVTRLDRQR